MSKRKVHTLNVYATYSFTNKDPIIDRMRTAIQDKFGRLDKTVLLGISEASGVSVGAYDGWFFKKTRQPRYSTLQATAVAIGGSIDINMGVSKVLAELKAQVIELAKHPKAKAKWAKRDKRKAKAMAKGMVAKRKLAAKRKRR